MYWEDLKEFLLFSFFVLGIPLSALLLTIEIYGRYVCGNYADITSRETRWVVLDACYINDADLGWVRYEERKSAIAAERGLKLLSEQEGQ